MAKYTRGKLAVLEIALVVAASPDVLVAAASRKKLLSTNSIKIGFGTTTVDFQNFASGGSTVTIPTGQTPRMELGETQWTDDDLTAQLMEKAAREGVEVWYVYYPKGVAAGKGYYGKFNVGEWDMTSPSDGLNTVAYSITPVGLPTPFGFPHLADNVEAATVTA
ncbi:hypothetical protein [Deinococcus sp. Leaf326]|uniref:hypothetical protein n=1 Tax=Deinococcus sp. Leaf326 TaxID=1736338 RepID=UPI0006F34782|nr:hypothetical protein [Deinococcus sp. Leaf326]KQR33120.1 hypothetical protein ASF71_16650 [Deinococcus sp. Leaf326]